MFISTPTKKSISNREESYENIYFSLILNDLSKNFILLLLTRMVTLNILPQLKAVIYKSLLPQLVSSRRK